MGDVANSLVITTNFFYKCIHQALEDLLQVSTPFRVNAGFWMQIEFILPLYLL